MMLESCSFILLIRSYPLSSGAKNRIHGAWFNQPPAMENAFDRSLSNFKRSFNRSSSIFSPEI